MSGYKIIDELPEGGFGRPFLAKNHLGVEYVLKAVRDKGAALSEATKLKQVGVHPNVVKVHEVTDDVEGHPKQPFIVMEHVKGQTLTAYLDTYGQLSRSAWWRLLVPILRGVDHIHRTHFHRDLKPDNIVLEDSNGNVNPVIIDFGLAAQYGAYPEAMGGTEGYYPPEWRRPEDMGKWFDIYSLSVISSEALYGEVLDRKEMQERLRKAGTTFESAIAEGLERNTYDRPQSIWDWIIAMASPTTEDQGNLGGVDHAHSSLAATLSSDDASGLSGERTDTEDRWGREWAAQSDTASRPNTVGRLRKEMEEFYGLPAGSIALCYPSRVVAGGGLHSERLLDAYNSKDYEECRTLRDLGNKVGRRFGLGNGCVRFVDPGLKGGSVGDRLFPPQTHVSTMIESYEGK